MILVRIDWTLVAICFSGAVTLYIIKFLVSLWTRSQMNPNESGISEKLEYQEPPPEFSNALKCSTPVSYVEIEEPPPSYSDYLQLSPSHPQSKPPEEIINQNTDNYVVNFTITSSTI